jgi:hypothetical protein
VGTCPKATKKDYNIYMWLWRKIKKICRIIRPVETVILNPFPVRFSKALKYLYSQI